MPHRDLFSPPSPGPPYATPASLFAQATLPPPWPLVDPWYGLPLVYRSMTDWQELARTRTLRPEDLLFDPVSGLWKQAAEFPALSWYFPRSIDWARLLSTGLIVAAGTWTLKKLAEALLEVDYRGLSWNDLRREVLRRDDYTCTYCGHRGDARTLEVDHRTPVSRGGGDETSNLVTACWMCNVEKGSRTEWEYRLWRLGRDLFR